MDGVFKLLEPNFHHDMEELCPDPPETLSFEAKSIWLEAAPELFKRGGLVGGNLMIFENFCIVSGHARDMNAMLEVDGRIVGGKPHPAYRMMLDAMITSRTLWAQLNPKSTPGNKESEEDSWGKDKGLLA